MRVLWLTHILPPKLAKSLGLETFNRGGWVSSLADALSESPAISLAIAVNMPGDLRAKDKVDNVQYYTIPMGTCKSTASRLPPALIRIYQEVIEDFRPDLIHIQGTEYFHGLLTGRNDIKTPAVISIQGILDVCQRYYQGEMTWKEILGSRTLRDWVRLDGLTEQKFKMQRRAANEQEIFASNSSFIGRTLWDMSHTRRLNPAARYYHCDELLRPPFHNSLWKLAKIKRHTVFASSAAYPLKGFHVLIKAVSLLRKEFPEISVRTPMASFYPKATGLNLFWKNCRSLGYSKYLTDLIKAEKLENNIIQLGNLDAAEMASEFEQAHVFVLPSFIENSPNSLGEAMIVGTPSVVSLVGGVPSMVMDGTSALCFPSGDETVLAEQIRRIFLDDDLAVRLSQEAHKTATIRHSTEKVVSNTMAIYEDVIIRGKRS